MDVKIPVRNVIAMAGLLVALILFFVGPFITISFLGIGTSFSLSSFMGGNLAGLARELASLQWISITVLISIVLSLVFIFFKGILFARIASLVGFAAMAFVFFMSAGTELGNLSGLLGWGYWVIAGILLVCAIIVETPKKTA